MAAFSPWGRNNPRLTATLLLGFSSGLPLALSGGTLQAWMTVVGVDLRTIGIFSLVGLPYTWKFLWAPLMDRYVPPLLGRRRGWMLLTQALLMMGISAMAFANPVSAPAGLAVLAALVAFASASQDTVVDAWRTDVLRPSERGLGAGLFVVGYRAAMLVSGAGALLLASQVGWRPAYLVMAALLGVGILTACLAPEPERHPVPPLNLTAAIVEPLREFLSREGVASLLLLVVLYKLGDAFQFALSTPFLIRGLGFSVAEVGAINKGAGLAAAVFGALLGGALMVRLGLYRSLLWFGVLQGSTALAFTWLALAGKSYPIMVGSVILENLATGMGSAAFAALLMALCDARYSATQYALLAAFSAVGRVYVGPSSGFIVLAVGWANFFLVAAAAAVPGVVLVWFLRGRLGGL